MPVAAYFFTPFSLLSLEMGYFLFQILNFFLIFIIIYLIYKIIQIHSEREAELNNVLELNQFKDLFQNNKNKNLLFQISIYLFYLPHLLNYFAGQINNLIAVLLLISLYLFLKKGMLNNFLGGLILGLSLLIKPIGIFIIPFIVVIFYEESLKKLKFNFKITFVRLFGCFISIIISLFYFLLYPSLLNSYIAINLSGEYTEETMGGLQKL